MSSGESAEGVKSETSEPDSTFDPIKPPHMASHEIDFENEDSGGYFPDQKSIESVYRAPERESYHLDRERSVKVLINELKLNQSVDPLTVLDFGIGDGLELASLKLPIGELIGIDTSPSMIKIADENISVERKTFFIGGVEKLSNVASGSVDLVLAMNVLGYLTQDEEKEFWTETRRLLKSNGYVLILVGNRLFDLFALNSGTSEFFQEQFEVPHAESLLRFTDSPRFKNARRHNPLELQNSLEIYGMSHVKTSFSQWHHTPPIILQNIQSLDIRSARSKARNHELDPNSISPDQKWRGYFQCSLVGLLFKTN
jgi:SAM-dependent methyltransferase